MKRMVSLTVMGTLAFWLASSAAHGGQQQIAGPQMSLRGKVVTEDGEALAGVTIKVRSESTGVDKIVLTGSDGSFRVESLPAGSYEVEAALEGFGVVAREVTLRPGLSALLTIELPVAVPITGTIAGVVRNEAGAAIAGANVNFSGPDGRGRSTQTSSGGTYRQTGLYPGSWGVVVEAAGYQPVQRDVVLGKREDKEENFKLKKKEKGEGGDE